jgi:4-hydroxybenzoate polyprenyltransferase
MRPNTFFRKYFPEDQMKSILPYIQIARPDNWFKNIFILPGILFGIYDSPDLLSWQIVPKIIIGFVATCLIASANYVMNEVLDAPTDALHPVKKNRPVPSGLINVKIAYIQWGLLAAIGLAAGWMINGFFFASLLLLLIMGLLYNLPPVRLKDLPYLDVLSESINNPIRLFLGWFAVNNSYPPTLSLVIAYWMIGAFFMAVKRYAEYMRIGDPERAGRYRKSFFHYNEYRLLLSIVYYISAFGLFFGIFLIRYRVELILCAPFIAGFISVYMRIGFKKNSPAQYPEKLYTQKSLVIYSLCFFFLFITLLFVDIPIVHQLIEPYHLPGE